MVRIVRIAIWVNAAALVLVVPVELFLALLPRVKCAFPVFSAILLVHAKVAVLVVGAVSIGSARLLSGGNVQGEPLVTFANVFGVLLRVGGAIELAAVGVVGGEVDCKIGFKLILFNFLLDFTK